MTNKIIYLREITGVFEIAVKDGNHVCKNVDGEEIPEQVRQSFTYVDETQPIEMVITARSYDLLKQKLHETGIVGAEHIQVTERISWVPW